MPYFTFEYRTLKLGTQIARRSVVVGSGSLEAASEYVCNLKYGTDARKHGEVIEDGRQMTEAETQEYLA